MSLLKVTHHGHKWLPRFLVFVAIIAATFVTYLQFQPIHSQWLSQGSIQKLHSLNLEHEMIVDSLLEEHWYLQTDLLKTNSLDVDAVEKEDHQGLLVTIDSDLIDKGFLLLQPAERITEYQLEEIAVKYQEAIPEFISVEVDQDIHLFGEPHYWVIPDELVNLANELRTDEEEIEIEEEEEPIIVGVIDSGVDASHPTFDQVNILTGWNTITDDTIMYDDVGHGTHIAGIISAETSEIEIIPYKIVDSNGGRLSNVLEAFNKAIDDKPDIINASFGLMSPSYSLEVMMAEAYTTDIIVVAAGGNSDSSRGFYPATYSTTLAVASVDPNGEAMDKSNYGNWIDIAANGYMVLSSLPDDQYGYKSGTSQAAALISARVADILASNSSLTLEEVIQALQVDRDEVEAGKLAGVSIVD
jgi:hypothetical protein